MRAEETQTEQPHSYTTARTLLSILRLSQALARLRLADSVSQVRFPAACGPVGRPHIRFACLRYSFVKQRLRYAGPLCAGLVGCTLPQQLTSHGSPVPVPVTCNAPHAYVRHCLLGASRQGRPDTSPFLTRSRTSTRRCG